jgi:hypothetical protein
VGKLARAQHARPTRQVGFFHFGAVATAFGYDMLVRLRAHGVVFCDVVEASSEPAYGDYCRDLDQTGLVSCAWGRSLSERVLRKVAALADRAESLRPQACGPRFPHLV